MKCTFPFLYAVFMSILFIQHSYAQPPNDTCATAQTLVVGVGSCTSILYTNVAATTIGNPATPACWTPNTMSNTVWFSFVATTADVEISTNFGGTLANTQIAIYSGTCGTLTQIGCQEDVNTVGGLLQTDVILHGLTAGNTYFIAVDGNGNATGTFGVCVQESLPIGPALPTQDCAGAQTLCSPSALSVPDGVGGVGSTQEAPTCFGAPGERSSNWYTFTAATSGNLEFTIVPNTSIDYDFAIFNTTTACLGTEISCNWSGVLGANGTTGLGCGGVQCNPVIAVTAGQTYTILIDRFTAASNSGFTLDFTGTTATFASPNPTFTATNACIGSPTQFTNTTNGNFTYSWNFGDGFTSNLENPSHTYATAGPHSVTLLLTAVPGGCQNSITQIVTVNPLPTVNAGAGGSVCPGACINLSGSTNASGSVGQIPFTNATSYVIPDNLASGVNSPINVTGVSPATIAAGSIASVCINIAHIWDEDLDIFLQCPNGTQIELSTDNGTLDDNYTNTCFTPTAINVIGTAGNNTGPFAGTYAPEQSFNLLNGCAANGNWQLFVRDDAAIIAGTITSWTITFNNNLPAFTWSPTTAMSNATTLTPTVCPLVPTTYTLTANNGIGCTATSQVTIGTTAGPTATISYPAAAACTTTGTQAVTLAGIGAYTGGAYSSTLGLTINSISGLITPSSSTPGPYTITYTIPASGGCPATTTTTTITINAQPNAGIDGSLAVCDSSIASIDLFSLITGEQAGGVWTRTSGAGGTFNSAAGTFVPAVGASSSTFTYTRTGVAPCVNDTSLATITINPQPDAGVDGSVAVCDSSIASIDLFSLITGEQAGGVWTRTSGAGGTFNVASGTFVPAVGASSSTFTYTLTGVAPCVNDTSLATITINPQPTAGVDGSVSVCDSSVASIDLFSLITGEQAGGVWTRTSGAGGTFNSAAGTFVPAVGASSSTFTYTRTGVAPCVNDTSLATITINPQPDAGVDGSVAVCDSSVASIDLFSLITGEQAGGVWTRTSGAGGIFNAAAGTFVPAVGASSSTFTYTLTGVAPCVNETSLATITINPQPNAGVDGSVAVCDSSVASIDLFSLITGEQAGGVWTRTSGAGGTFNSAAGTFVPALGASSSTFTYTLIGVAPCVNDTSLATITINPQPTAGVDGSVAVCDSSIASIDLFSLITGEQAGGVWTRTSGAGGTFNAAGGTFVPAVGASSSTFTYTLIGVAPCVDDTSLATITINPQPDAGVDGSVAVCDSSVASIDLFSLITSEQAGGVWTRTSGAGGTFNSAAGTFVPAVGASSSTFTYTLIVVAPCVNDTSLATITINPQPTAGVDGSTAVCDSSIASIDLFSLITGEQAGGVWTRTSGAGGTFNSAAGTFVPAVGASSSTFTYTLTGVAPCVNDTALATITINPQPIAGVDGSTAVCDSSIASIDLFSLITGEQAGGVWTRTSGAGGIFNAAAGTFVPAVGASSSTFTYTLTGVAPCVNDTALATITINPQPIAGVDGSTAVCESSIASIDLFSLITGEQAGGVWTRTSGAGGTFNSAAGTFVPAVGASSSTFTYTRTGVAPCVNDTALATITINPQPIAGVDGSAAVCESSIASIDLFSLITGEQAGGVWTQSSGAGGTFNAALGTFVPAVGASSSTFTYTVSAVAPCASDSSLASVTINPVLTPTINCGASTTTSVVFNWASVTGATGYTVSYQINANPIVVVGPIGNLFTYSVSGLTPGDNVTISVTPTGGVGTCFASASATCTANNCNPPTASISYAGSPFCSSDASVQPVTLVGTGLFSGGVYSSTIGLSLNTANGEIIASTSTPGPYAITYTIAATAGCSPVVATTAIVINAPPVAGVDGSTAVCESSIASIDLFSLITGEQAGGVWTRTSGAGGIFNAAAGTFVPAVGASSSTFTYTLTGVAPCASDSSLASVTINPVLTPTINCGASTTTSVVFNWASVTGATGYTVSYQINANPIVVVGPIGNLLTYSVSGLTPGDNVTISVTPTGGVGTCFASASATCTANNCNPPTASISYAGSPFCSSDASVQPVTLVGTGLFSGGVYSSTLGLSLNTANGEIVASTSTPGPYTITYTIAATTGCSPVVATTAIVINAPPVAGVDGSAAVCESSIASIDLFSLITGEQGGGVWTRTSGLGGTFNATVGTFVPAVGASSSTFTYTVSGVAPCASDSAIASVTINPVLSPTINCGASTTTSVIFNWASVTGATGYTVSYQINANPIVVVGPIGNLLTYSVSGLTPGDNVTISVTPTGGVGTCFASASATCTANNCNPPTASISYAGNPFCSSDASVQSVTLVGTGLFTGGVYSSTLGLSLNTANGEIVASTSTPGPYTITYTIAATTGCSPVVATTAIVINAPPVAGVDGSAAVCESSITSIDLFSLITGEQTGGVWTRTSGSGGTFNSALGTFVPAVGASSSTFTYTLTGIAPCVNDTSLATITINSQPNAGVDGSVTVCNSSVASIDLFSLITGEQAGGVWTRTSGVGGSFNAGAGTFVPVLGASSSTFTYTLTGVSPCVNDTSVATISIIAQPNAGADGSTIICESSVAIIDLFSLISGEPVGGVWTRTSGAGGTFNAAAGTFVPAVGASSSTFTYTVSGVAPCVNDTSLATVTINSQPNAGVGGNVTVCDSSTASIDLFSLITGEQAGGLWTRTSGAGGTFNAAGGTFIPAAGASSSTFTYQLIGAAPCINNSSLATITINPQPNAGVDGSTSVCETNNASINLFSLITGEQSGGVWTRTSGIGGTFNAATGTFIPTVGATTSTFIYTLNGVSPCIPDSSLATVTITAQPIAGTLSGIQTVCQGNTRNFSSTAAGGTWTSSNLSVATVTPLTGIVVGISPGIATITYTILGTGGCPNATVDRQITVTPTPQLTNSGINIICSNETSNVLLTATASGTNFTWTVSQSGVTGGNNGSGTSINQTLSSTNGGNAIYTVTPTLNGCVGNSAYVVINVKPLPRPTLNDGHICIELSSGNASQPFVFNAGLSDSSHDFQWYFNGSSILDETSASLAVSEAGEYSVITTNSTTGCVSGEVYATITSSVIADAFTTSVTEAFEDYPYIIVNTPAGTGPFQYQLDSGAFQNSNVFYNVPSGLHTINVKDNEGCTDLNGEVFILNYPHFFTPNGDTYNDTWNIWDLKNQPIDGIFIFDRYGKFIKQISPRGTGWDGTLNGYELPATDYWFTVDYFDQNTKSSSTFKSHFSLKR